MVKSTLGFRRRIIYSAIGLIAGDFLMVILIALISKMWEQPASNSLRTFYFAFDCSLFGWVVVGIPAVLLINTAFVARLKWYFEALIGALLGIVALLAIFMITIGHTLPVESGGYAYFWIFAALVSTVAFSIYCALARQAMRQQERNDAQTPKDEPLRILRPLTRIDVSSAVREEKLGRADAASPDLTNPDLANLRSFVDAVRAESVPESGAELPLDIYNSEWLNTLEPTDPRRSTSEVSRPPDSKPS